MAKTFRHTITDGGIYINNNATESHYPYSWWITQEPGYTYPANAIYVQYTEDGVPGQSYYHTNDNNQYGLPVDPWLAADGYIAKQALYDADYAEYIGTPQTLGEAKTQKFSSLFSLYVEKRDGEVIYDSNTFPSDFTNYQLRSSELSYSTSLSAVPVGYYVKDIDGVHVSLDLAGVEALLHVIEELHYLCRINYDIHYENIDILTDIEDVIYYNITTGWPTIPYSP
jgi:hypothetical protein